MQLIKRSPDEGYLDSSLWVPKKHINVEGTKKALTFTFMDQQKVNVISLWRETSNHLILPREFWEPNSVPFKVTDTRPRRYEKVAIPDQITLDFISPNETIQRDAFNALVNARGGILQLACGLGKTVIALKLAAHMSVPTLIIVDNTQLLSQWKDAILGDGKEKRPLLLLSPENVGLIQGPVFDWKKPIVLATYHTLAALAPTMPEEVRRWFGLIIWDEGHHIAAPTFSQTADLFYGYRLSLTATPTRVDGLHIVYEYHIGKVLFKYLKQELRPEIYFKWTGLELDLHDPVVRAGACDKNGELHISKLATYMGSWETRLRFILAEVKNALNEGRKMLVLSNSVDELVNLICLWTLYGKKYTDVEVPTPEELGYKVPPLSLAPVKEKSLKRLRQNIAIQLRDPLINPIKRQNLQLRKAEIEHQLDMHDVARALINETNKRKNAFLKKLLTYIEKHDVGLMIHKVKTEVRTEMLRTKKVTFAIAKYGREGLDEPSLDTILVCEPFSNRNTLQQVMGRTLRKKDGKKSSKVIFLEDNIGPMIGMCQKLRRALREWPEDENGPYEYELLGYPQQRRKIHGSY